MKYRTAVAAGALLAAGLIACNQQPTDKAPKSAAAPSPVADASKESKPSQEPTQAFQSNVSPKPEAGGGQQASDAELSGKVKNALAHAPDIRTGAIEVASTNGVVTLYGTVDAPSEKDRAAVLAMEVEGVRSVVNNLVVVRGS